MKIISIVLITAFSYPSQQQQWDRPNSSPEWPQQSLLSQSEFELEDEFGTPPSLPPQPEWSGSNGAADWEPPPHRLPNLPELETETEEETPLLLPQSNVEPEWGPPPPPQLSSRPEIETETEEETPLLLPPQSEWNESNVFGIQPQQQWSSPEGVVGPYGPPGQSITDPPSVLHWEPAPYPEGGIRQKPISDSPSVLQWAPAPHPDWSEPPPPQPVDRPGYPE